MKKRKSAAQLEGERQLKAIIKTEWCPKFIQGMQDRMVVSFCKYGAVKDAAGRVDMIKSLQQRLDKYRDTKNTEFLMDAANFAMIEFMFPQVPGAFFQGTDADQSPGRTRTAGSVDAEHNLGNELHSKIQKHRSHEGD